MVHIDCCGVGTEISFKDVLKEVYAKWLQQAERPLCGMFPSSSMAFGLGSDKHCRRVCGLIYAFCSATGVAPVTWDLWQLH
eukprot:5733476-Amphidinium_carterae.1